MKRGRPEKNEPARPHDEAHWLRRAAGAAEQARAYRALAFEQERRREECEGTVKARMHADARTAFLAVADVWEADRAQYEEIARQAALNDAADAVGVKIPDIHDCAHGVFCPHNGEAGDV